jgi:predicted DNA-binding protein with PD1-like motif
VSFKAHRGEKVRHLVLRASSEEVLPDALLEILHQEGVACGWLHASGVLTDVALRAYGAELGALGSAHLIAGPVQAIAVDGFVGVADGAPTCSLRAVLARETDRGLETVGGEILSARVVALEVLVTALDDLALGRSLDEAAGVWMLSAPDATFQRRAPARAGASPATPAWSAALEASSDADRSPAPAPRVHSAPHAQSAPIPARPVRPGVDLDGPVPEAGDVVDHFAFGRCDVLKSDGDRLHLKIHKDGRIREIALEMLRVVRLPEEDGKPHRFKLERRI